MTVVALILLAALSGTLGRMGGSGEQGQWYSKLLNTNWRDIGCATIWILSTVLCFGWSSSHWWAYALSALCTFAAFRTYWDRLFGYDNLWFSGFMVGVAGLPLIFVFPWAAGIFILRAVLMATIWGCLNKYLPDKIFVWRRDIVEEFYRYFVSL